VDAEHQMPEVAIPRGSSTTRGALSYAFARMIEGTTRTQSPGVATRRDLYDAIKASAEVYAEHEQKPEFFPRARFDEPVIDFQRDLTVTAAASPVKQPTISNEVRILVKNGEAITRTSVANGKIVMRPVGENEQPDIVYDVQDGAVYSGRGDLLAERLKIQDLAGVAQREFALRRLIELAKSRPHVLELPQGDHRYHFHKFIQIDARKTPPEYNDEFFGLIDLTATGEIQFLTPKDDNSPILPKDRMISNMRVIPPYGADTLVLVTSPRPLDSLLVQLRALDQKQEALAAVDAIEAALSAEAKIGVHQFFTAPGEETSKN
jgi:hypothetical protein